jgi:hypothetical protein
MVEEAEAMSYSTDMYTLAVLTDKPLQLSEIMERIWMLCKVTSHPPFTEQGVAKALAYLTRHKLAVESPAGRWRKGDLSTAKEYRDETERVREMRRERFEARGEKYRFEVDPIAAEERDKERERIERRFKAPDRPWRMPL